MDIIASCTFGVDAGSFKTGEEKKTEFIEMADSLWRIEGGRDQQHQFMRLTGI
jgi:hypothetical protein